MGTSYAVRMAGVPPGETEQSLRALVESALAEVEAAMSTWDAQSELSRFNARRTTRWVPVSAGLHRVVSAALGISEQTGGAFDITASPLVDLWGFGAPGRRISVPDDADVDAAAEHVGYRRLAVRGPPFEMRKRDADAAVDLSAIAKGYGVDLVAEKLLARGARDFFVEVGGEVRAHGARPDGGPWRIGIELPKTGERRIEQVIELRDAAIATSGDYRNFFEAEGQRFSHTIDPRTGRPVRHDLAAVSVTAATAMLADGWATALLVLGPEEAYRVAAANGITALLIRRRDDTFVTIRTPGFPPAGGAR